MKAVKAWAVLDRDETDNYSVIPNVLYQEAGDRYVIFSSYRSAYDASGCGREGVRLVEIRELRPVRKKGKV